MSVILNWLFWSNVGAFIVVDLLLTPVLRQKSDVKQMPRSLIPTLDRFTIAATPGSSKSTPQALFLMINVVQRMRAALALAYVICFILFYGQFRGVFFLELLELRLDAHG